MPNAKSVHCPPLPRSSHSLLLAERLGLRVEGPVTDVEEEEADGEDDARVLVDDVDVLDAGQRLLHHARPAFELKQGNVSMMQTIQRSPLLCAPGLVKFVPAVAKQFSCLGLS